MYSLTTKFIGIATQEIKDVKAKYNEEFERYLSDSRITIIEYRRLFMFNLAKQIESKLTSIRIDNQYRSIDEICNSDKLFNALVNLSTKFDYSYYYGYGTSNSSSTFNISSYYSSSAYSQRIKRVSDEGNSLLMEQMRDCDERIRRISGKSLAQLLTEFPSVRKPNALKDLMLPDLMMVFMIEGYIDENYYDYISYFYEGMISPADREYILSIRQLHAPKYNRHIDKIDNFVKELRSNNFISDSILNIELLNYFTSNKSRDPKISDFYNLMVDVIDASPKKYDFLSEYCISSNSAGTFLEPYYKPRLSSIWKDIVSLPANEKRNILFVSILLFGRDLNDEIFKWICDNYSFVENHYSYIEDNRLKFIIENATFSVLQSGNDPLLNLVISEYSYTITKDNLRVVLASVYNKPEATIQDITLDNIRNCGNDDVKSYLLDEDNFSTTFDCKNIQYNNESLESIEYILKSNLPEEKKRDFLVGQECRRENAIDLTDELAIMMYECNLIVPTWKNVSILFKKYGSNTARVINFIKANCESLSIEKSASGIDKEVELFDLLFGSNEHLTFEEYVFFDKAFECYDEGYE